MTDEGIKTFDGFKKIVSDYVNGYKTYENIDSERTSLSSYTNDNDANNSINIGYNIILSLIMTYDIKYDKEAIIKSIGDTDKKLGNNHYYLMDRSGKIISSKYNNLLNKFLNLFINNPSGLNIDNINNIINKITGAIYKIRYKDIDHMMKRLKEVVIYITHYCK